LPAALQAQADDEGQNRQAGQSAPPRGVTSRISERFIHLIWLLHHRNLQSTWLSTVPAKMLTVKVCS
jgi:hypothetical protein